MNKPYIKKSQFITEIVSYVVLFATIIYVIIKICTTEGEIPTHWDLSGEIDGYGSPATMLILPIIMFFSNLIISISLHFLSAQSWNLPCKPKPGREIIILSDMVWMMVGMELVISVFTLIMTVGFQNFSVVIGSCVWMMILIFAVIIAATCAALKHNK